MTFSRAGEDSWVYAIPSKTNRFVGSLMTCQINLIIFLSKKIPLAFFVSGIFLPTYLSWHHPDRLMLQAICIDLIAVRLDDTPYKKDLWQMII